MGKAVNRSRLKALPFFIGLILISVFGGIILAISTPMGMGQINDSTAYIAGARSVLAGTGYSEIWLASNTEPIIHYPPLLSSILALMGVFGLDPARGIRALNIFLYSGNIFLMGILGWRMTSRKLVGVLLALGFTLDGTLLRVHAYAISEPLFILLLISSILLIGRYINNKITHLLVLAGLVTGLTLITRYVGLAVLVTILVTLIIFISTWRKRLGALGIFLLFALPLLLAWIYRNQHLTGMATNRGISWHPISIDNIRFGLTNFIDWLIPIHNTDFNYYLLSASILGLIFCVVLAWTGYTGIMNFIRPPRIPKPNPYAFTTGVFLLIYSGSIIASMSFFDGTTKFQDRILSPIYIALLILFVTLFAWVWITQNMKARVLVSIVVFILFFSSSINYYQVVVKLRQDGLGYTSVRFQKSTIANHIRQLPEKIKIYTNSPPAVYSTTDRSSYIIFLDTELNDSTLKYFSNINYEVHTGEAVLALFGVSMDTINNSVFDQLTDGLKLRVKYGTHMLYDNNPSQ